MKKKLISVILACLLITLNSPLPARANLMAIVLSDAQLDTISAAGFDINIAAAYAFRAAIINQSNIATVACLSNGTGTVNINASNEAQVFNQAGPTLSNQQNISAVVAQVGDINNALIKNSNILSVVNEYLDAIESNQNPEIPVTDLQAPGCLETPETNPLPTNVPALEALKDVIQTNISILAAPNGCIENGGIENLNSALVDSGGNPVNTDQINISVVIAKNGIDAIINNTNVAAIDDLMTTHSSVDVASVLEGNEVNDVLETVNVATQVDTQAAQKNITIIKSTGFNAGAFKNKLLQNLNSVKKVINIH